MPPLKPKTDTPFTPSVFDHGIDIIGDEWDDPEEEKESTEETLERILPIPKMEKKYVPEHPYCTNWPVADKKEKKDEDI